MEHTGFFFYILIAANRELVILVLNYDFNNVAAAVTPVPSPLQTAGVRVAEQEPAERAAGLSCAPCRRRAEKGACPRGHGPGGDAGPRAGWGCAATARVGMRPTCGVAMWAHARGGGCGPTRGVAVRAHALHAPKHRDSFLPI